METVLLVPIEPTSPGEPALMSLLGISRSRAFGLIAAGAIQSVKIGRRRMVVRASIDRYVQTLLAAEATATDAA